MQILLAEVPAPRIPAAFPPEPLPDPLPVTLPDMETTPLPSRPSRLAPIKALVQLTYFDPTKAFASEVDWARFRRAQIYLFLLTLGVPFLMLVVLGFLLGVVYLTGASLYNATSPNPFYQLMFYPLIFVLARGYWMAYLALPLGLFAMGWLWAAPTAWVLSRIGNGNAIDYKKALSILAMLGAMLGPFTMFPFLRLLAMAVILWFMVRRLEDTFDIGFWPLVSRGGLILLGTVFLYGAFERKVESTFPAGEELRGNLTAFIQQRKMLEWPSFRAKVYINPNDRLFADLSDFSAPIRDQATQKALSLLKSGADTPDFRFRLAQRLAEYGQPEAYLFLYRYHATGQGTPVDPAAALLWIQKYTEVNPGNLEAGLDRVRMLLQNNRRLEAKQSLVGLAKSHLSSLHKITDFIQKAGLGRCDTTLDYEVQSLYQDGNTTSYVSSYSSDSGASRYGYEPQTRQEALLKRLYAEGQEHSVWFYRVMAADYNRNMTAGPEIYGEAPTDFGQAQLDQKILEGDAVAMDIVADRSARDGDIVKARHYWLAATRVLNSDNRYPNVAFYLKLAESYDPGESAKAPDSREATKYYLAALLISTGQRRAPIGMASLQRLNTVRLPDPLGQPFLDLCLTYDIPEAWVMMGDRYLNGDFPGVPKHLAKSRECFLKAQSLGYKGPLFLKQLTLMTSPNPPGH